MPPIVEFIQPIHPDGSSTEPEAWDIQTLGVTDGPEWVVGPLQILEAPEAVDCLPEVDLEGICREVLAHPLYQGEPDPELLAECVEVNQTECIIVDVPELPDDTLWLRMRACTGVSCSNYSDPIVVPEPTAIGVELMLGALMLLVAVKLRSI